MSLTKLYQKFESLCDVNKFRTFTLAEIKLIIDEEIKEIMEKNKTTNQFTFGKYRGKTVEDIAKLDKPYLSWVDRQPWFSNFTELKAGLRNTFKTGQKYFFILDPQPTL